MHKLVKKKQFSGMCALLLAAGYGSRLRPLTDNTPKCLIKINQMPLLKIWLDGLIQVGFKKIFINTHYLHEKVEAFINNYSEKDRIELVFEKNLLGSVGTLKMLRDRLGEEFFLAHADNLSIFNYDKFYKTFSNVPKDYYGVMMTFKADNPAACGIIEVDHQNNLLAYSEKPSNPSSDLANAAVFILNKKVFDIIDKFPLANDFCADILPHAVNNITTYFNDTYHRDIGTPESLAQADMDMRKAF